MLEKETLCGVCGTELEYKERSSPSDVMFLADDIKGEYIGNKIYKCLKCGRTMACYKTVPMAVRDGIYWSYREGLRNIGAENLENGIRRLIIDKVKDKKVFLDVGACIGVHSINLSKHFEIIYAIEPHPLNVEMLLENIVANNIPNVVVFKMAAWDKPFVLNLFRVYKGGIDGGVFVGETNDGGPLMEAHIRFIKPTTPTIGEKVTETSGMALDDLNLSPSVIKIDVEGAEMNVLKGLVNTLHLCRPVVIVETHMNLGIKVEDVKSFMTKNGYDHYQHLNKDNVVSHDIFWFGDSVEDFNSKDYSDEMSAYIHEEVVLILQQINLFRVIK